MELKVVWKAPATHVCPLCPETSIFFVVTCEKMPSSKEAQEALLIPSEHQVFVQDSKGPWCTNGETLYEIHVMPKCKHEQFLEEAKATIRQDPKLKEKDCILKL